MPTAIISGLVRSQIKRIDSFVQNGGAAYLQGWEIVYIAARKNTAELSQQDAHSVMEEASRHRQPHIIGVSTRDGGIRHAIAGSVKEYFRFRWLDNRLLAHLGNNFRQFVVGLNDILAEEDLWADEVRPTDIRSPLLLPRMCFDAYREHSRIWSLAEEYGDVGNIEYAATALERFRARYFLQIEAGNPRRWIDQSDRVFDHTGPRHGVSPFPRNWKYSFEFEQGLHFDVRDRNNKAFKVRDYASSSHQIKANGYINIDPHGHVRGSA